MILNATPKTSQPGGAARDRPALIPLVVIALLAIAVVGTGIAYLDTARGATSYACMSISHQGSTVQITTSGLLHYIGSQYYISCGEGSSLPTSYFTSSCLTISPSLIPAKIGVGASTEYYYLGVTAGHTITLQGSAPLANGGEIITMSGVSIVAAC